MKHMEKLVSFITNEYVVRITVLCLALTTPFEIEKGINEAYRKAS